MIATLRRAGAPYRLSAGDLASSMLLSPAATTNRINQLEAAGLVERLADPDDGRAVIVGLTRRGRTSCRAGGPLALGQRAAPAAGLSRDDERTLGELLVALGRSIGENARDR